ncbi:chromosomal replication initiator protein DnaA [Polynucleobacter sp. AP-Latsch-80-C2]|jgi:chromosomal replication initiator protein|uniref:chromosomal replication initiator protein DnaA n=1 Tax=Polynucleobacter sp. AP-Latsch-80-C2 TaxID=2576931 RepID=UPI001C0E30A9|nr:chromosomal replication initiator protein DnaA [Polynucleobacter sp. AP-Latsch-80-C2]MBU3622680.1 chromosomal replication initiator protein DnaA [Polynucleobacter sp. AP-Latsch-80-C2]
MSNLQNPPALNSISPLGFWDSAIGALSRELSPQQFKTWIQPLSFMSYEESGHSLTIGAPNRFKLDWIKKTFADRFQELASQYFGLPINVNFVLDVEGGASSAKPSPTVELVVVEPNEPLETESVILVEEQSFEIEDHSKLNPNLTFETFVTGKANQLARAASIQVAHNPGTSYNPMFLYGGVGLGKTHLIHAIGNHLLKEKPNARIRYIHAEQYVSDVVRAYQQKAFDRFKRYYHSLDLLLIDDIQFFSGKSRTQEEFFYAFEALLSNKSQVIITSDTYPKEMAGIDDRLISRFDSGLTVAIEPPELEMRVAILMKKAISEGIPMSEDVAFFVAKHLRSNVRELEGALRKILAFVRFHGREVTIEVARTALKDLLSIQNRQISVENIQKSVADFYSIKVADMYSKKRPANIARPRQIAMFMAKELTQKSLPEIGELFGGRDHTTVLHAVRKITEERSHDSQLNHEIHVIEQTLKA